MAITLVGSDTAGGNLATIAPAWANVGTTASGDFALLAWTFQNTMTATAPSGFTQLATNNTNSGSATSRIYYRVLDGSESGTVSLTNSGANRQSAVLRVYRGTDNVGGAVAAAIDAFAWRAESTSGATHASPGITTVAADDAIVVAILERASSGTTSWTAPSGYANEIDTDGLAIGSGGTITGMADKLAAGTPGGTSVTPGSWTSGNSFATANVGTWTIALKPSGGVTVADAAATRVSARMAPVGVRVAAGTAPIRSAGAVRPASVRVAAGASSLRGSARSSGAGTKSASNGNSIGVTGRQSVGSSRSASGSTAVRGTSGDVPNGGRVAQQAARIIAGDTWMSPSAVARSGQSTVRSAGALTGSAQKRVSGVLVTTGTASGLAPGVKATSGSARVSGGARMASGGTKGTSGQASVTGRGGLADLAVRLVTGVVVVSATDGAAARGVRSVACVVAVRAHATVTASEINEASEMADLYGSARILPVGAKVATGVVALVAGQAQVTDGLRGVTGSGQIVAGSGLLTSGVRSAFSVSNIRSAGSARPSGLRQARGLVTISGTGRSVFTASRMSSGSAFLAGSSRSVWTGGKDVFGISSITASGVLLATSLNPDSLVPGSIIVTISRTGPESSTGIQQYALLAPLFEGVNMTMTSDDEIYPARVIEQDGQVLLVYLEPVIVLSADG